MKTYIVSFILAVCSLSLSAQSQDTNVEIGTIFKIGKPQLNTYKHIHFPKPNIIIKRGGIANYKSVKGRMVVVTAIEENSLGATIVKFKRKDGGRFFGSHSVIKADLKGALQSGELVGS